MSNNSNLNAVNVKVANDSNDSTAKSEEVSNGFSSFMPAFGSTVAPVNQPTNQSTFDRESGSISSLVYSRYRDSDVPFNAPGQQMNSTANLVVPMNSIVTQNGQTLFNWQSSKSTIKERLNCVLYRETLADIHFLVGKEAESIPAHKFILSVGSAVFNAMFNGKMATTEENIRLPDVEPPAFRALLRFLYTDEVEIDPETVMMTLYTAKKYAVPALEKACVEFLKQNLSSDNAFMLLTQARLFDETVLAQMCLDTIDKHTVDALSAEGFLDIDHD
ncbi:BTB/POZ domain-containing protein 2-like protein, partial [Leptotrombidium deliense]